MVLEPSCGKLLFFSRGKGRGHAIPDAAIASELCRIQSNLIVKFASYSTGAKTLRELRWDVADLDMPEDPGAWDVVCAAHRLIVDLKPTLVVSHEEFCAIPIAKAFDCQTVYLTDWLMGPDSFQMQALKYSDEVIMLDQPGYYDVPLFLNDKVTYAGCVLGTLDCRDDARLSKRSSLNIDQKSKLILVVPGSAEFHSEDRAPIFDLVLAAYDLLEAPHGKRLIWVAPERDYSYLAEKTTQRADIRVLKPHPDILATMAAADVVITKGNRISTLESQSIGTPSISISYGHNPVDEYRVSRIRSNTALRWRGLNKETLKQYIVEALAQAKSLAPRSPSEVRSSTEIVARRIRHHLTIHRSH